MALRWKVLSRSSFFIDLRVKLSGVARYLDVCAWPPVPDGPATALGSGTIELCTTMCSSASGHNKTPVSGSFQCLGAVEVLAAWWRRRLMRWRRDAAEPLRLLSSAVTLSRAVARDRSCSVRWRSIQMAAAAASKSPSRRGATGASWRTMIGGSRLTVGVEVADSSGSDTVVVVVRVIAVVVVDVCPASEARSVSCRLSPPSLPSDSPSPCFELNSSAPQHFTASRQFQNSKAHPSNIIDTPA